VQQVAFSQNVFFIVVDLLLRVAIGRVLIVFLLLLPILIVVDLGHHQSTIGYFRGCILDVV
jgi:hypothetical protein